MFYPDIPTPNDLKAFRIRHGLANYQAANLINVGLSSWRRYEKGTLKPSTFNWALLLNAVGELDLPPNDRLTPFARRALSFVPPVAYKAGNAREGYVPPEPEQIISLRKKAMLTREQCNELLGLKSSTHWGKYERGEIVMAEREWVIFQVALDAIPAPAFSDFETALKKVPMYSKEPDFIPPTPEQIRAFLTAHEITPAEVAEYLSLRERIVRAYIAHINPQPITEKNWKLLKQIAKKKEKLPANPDYSDFPEPRTVETPDEIQVAFSEVAHVADIVKKRNSKRKRNISPMPTFEMQFVVQNQGTQLALFYRSPDYVNNYWSMWRGFLMAENEAHKFLAALSKRMGNINVAFE